MKNIIENFWRVAVESEDEAAIDCNPVRLDFRNRFGLLWGQRVREQFQRSATHAGWPGCLAWSGWLMADNQRALTEEEKTEMVKTLKALLKQFEAKG